MSLRGLQLSKTPASRYIIDVDSEPIHSLETDGRSLLVLSFTLVWESESVRSLDAVDGERGRFLEVGMATKVDGSRENEWEHEAKAGANRTWVSGKRRDDIVSTG